MINEHKVNKCISSILGFVIGDALGVPVEFKSRVELRENPVIDMRAYGTHLQPAGTWSDDTSMVVATMEWFREMNAMEPDYKLLMDKFCAWLLHGDYTPHQNCFDCGIATSKAIMNYGRGAEPLQCGEKSENHNGNGSLMRILPVALKYSESLAGDDMSEVEIIYNMSALTHGHMRSKMGCLIYSKIIADILLHPSDDKFATVEKSLVICKKYLESIHNNDVTYETQMYARLWDLKKFKNIVESDIKSSGYVVDTLEAAIWCFLNTDNYKDCVLKAVNLGDDTDTVGAVAGGLAGLFYGIENIPREWITIIPKLDWIVELTSEML